MVNKAAKFLKIIQVKNLQRQINKKFEKEGFSDELLDMQVEVNAIRHEYNISDDSKRICDNWVQ